jgi:lipid II:glycine glycyltransferase (peptidoglycan interpeptide bridge formation enzyme)
MNEMKPDEERQEDYAVPPQLQPRNRADVFGSAPSLGPVMAAVRKKKVEAIVDELLAEVRQELLTALKVHPKRDDSGRDIGFSSAHEGYAVILEELDELWELVKGHGEGYRNVAKAEAKQVAAMAVRYMLMVCMR